MWFKSTMTFVSAPRWALLGVVLALLGCEGQQSTTNLNNTFNFRTNAYMSAFQDGNGAWELSVSDNSDNALRQRNYSLENPNGQYGVMYVCASKFDGRNHEIYLYYLTVAEMRVSTHTCRVAESRLLTKYISGPLLKSLDGTTPHGNTKWESEMGVVAISRDSNVRGYESYATGFYGIDKDVLAYKGTLQADMSIAPSHYYRLKQSFASTVNRLPINFDRTNLDQADKKIVSAAGMAPATITIEGETVDESVESVFGFGSEQETFLPLTHSNSKASFQVTGVPPAFFNLTTTGELAKEGHELHVTATSPSGSERKVVAFFDQPKDMTLVLPAAPTGGLGLAAEDGSKERGGYTAEIRRFHITLPEYQDPHYGSASLYEVDLRGRSSYSGPTRIQWPIDSDPPEYVLVPIELEWHLFVSRGWLQANGSREIVLPDFDSLSGWDYDWDFASGTSGKVAVNIYATDQNAGPLLKHLEDGEYINGAAFGMVQQRTELQVTPAP